MPIQLPPRLCISGAMHDLVNTAGKILDIVNPRTKRQALNQW